MLRQNLSHSLPYFRVCKHRASSELVIQKPLDEQQEESLSPEKASTRVDAYRGSRSREGVCECQELRSVGALVKFYRISIVLFAVEVGQLRADKVHDTRMKISKRSAAGNASMVRFELSLEAG